MTEARSSAEPLPSGCHSSSSGWPWRRSLPNAVFHTLRFETELLCSANLDAWDIALPPPLTTAAAKRQAEFLGGRLSARRALGDLTGQASTPARNAQQLPEWPQGVTGSITHSRGLAAAVVAKRANFQSIGLDAEVVMSDERATRLAPQILVESERQWLERLPRHACGDFVTLVFSLKESLFKALYPLVHQRFYFPDARLIEWNAEQGTVMIELLKTLSPRWSNGSRLCGQVTKIDDYLLTLIAIPGQS